ncbi:hypothetical protein PV661_11945 [Streptomyces sp. MD20-1-1]|uniref:hypothetical protein n=1 Tax=Streptomyces sp. MD20-1-1 TaxID=3028668 RepID=UPI0029A1308D|nr:hypothetical protein [Streptomyces sp. MD20-1-1]
MTDPLSMLTPYLTPTRDLRFEAACRIILAWQSGDDASAADLTLFPDRLAVARYLAGRLAVPADVRLASLQPAIAALFSLARG